MPRPTITKVNRLTFFPSVSIDKSTWFWKSGIQSDGLLISYDVLLTDPDFDVNIKQNVNHALGFDGYVIIDSGAFGKSIEQDPMIVYTTQKRLRPDMAILLDQIPGINDTEHEQKQKIDATLKNAGIVSKLNRKIVLMAVVQGNSEKLLKYCSVALRKMDFTVIGIPLSYYSKYRRYEAAINKVKSVQKHFDDKTIFHALGCGSRTLIALLAHFGVRFFDSSAYYKAALHKDVVKPVTYCSINKPGSKPECSSCLARQRKPGNFKTIANYNLRETLKEVQRTRCALQEGVMKDYLMTRLGKTAFKKIAHML